MNELIFLFSLLFRAFLPFSYLCLLKVPLVLSFQGKNRNIFYLLVKPEFEGNHLKRLKKRFRFFSLFDNVIHTLYAVTILLASVRSSILTASSRILYFSIFPAAFMGNELTNATYLGTLCFAM